MHIQIRETLVHISISQSGRYRSPEGTATIQKTRGNYEAAVYLLKEGRFQEDVTSVLLLLLLLLLLF